MSKRDAFRDLFTALNDAGLLEYGSFIPQSLVHKTLGIDMPEVGTRRDFQDIALLELAAVDYVRNALLDNGRYLGSAFGGYRVLLPSENAGQVELYMSSADKKLSRALKLSRSTPKAPGDEKHDQQEARIAMKKLGVKSSRMETR